MAIHSSALAWRESQGQSSLAGYGPWGRRESDPTERPGTEHSATERPGAEHSATERPGAEHSATERPGAEHSACGQLLGSVGGIGSINRLLEGGALRPEAPRCRLPL